MTPRRERLLCYGGIVGATAAIFALLCGHSDAPPSFTLIPIKQINQRGTNFIVFRLTSLDVTRLSLWDPGHIEVLLESKRPHSARLPLWRRYYYPAQCVTNFAPTEFRRRVEFVIRSPTNRIWRLQLRLERTVRLMVWKERFQKEWECLKGFNFAAMGAAWSVPSQLVCSYYVWSPDFTNKVSAEPGP